MQQFGLTYLFITHDLGVVRHMSDRVAVMYLGRLLNWQAMTIFMKSAAPLYASPAFSHPHSRSSVKKQRMMLSGDMPSPLEPPTDAPFIPMSF